MSVAALIYGMSRDQLRETARRYLPVAQLVASMTSTPKDDQLVSLAVAVVNDDRLWNSMCDLLGLA